jgi:hypothetical protein
MPLSGLERIEMKKPGEADFNRLGVSEREATNQLLWTTMWTFTFLFMSIYFLQSA